MGILNFILKDRWN